MNHTRLIDILSELTHARLTKRQRALVKEMADALYALQAKIAEMDKVHPGLSKRVDW